MNLKNLKKGFIFTILFYTVKIFAALKDCETDCKNDATADPAVTSSCTDQGYCISDSNTIKIVNSNKLPGSTKFGKSGTTPGNYFFDGNGVLVTAKKNSQTIDSGYYCDSSGCIPIPTTTGKTYINTKASDLTCAYIKRETSFECGSANENESYIDDSSKKVINCSSKKCSLTSAAGYYIDYGAVDKIIFCSGNSCTNDINLNSPATDRFYLNAGLDKSINPIIKYDNNKTSGQKLSPISGNTEQAFLDYSTVIDPSSTGSLSYRNLITCSSYKKCSSASYDSGIFLSSTSTILIKCESSGCSELNTEDSANTNKGSKNAKSYYIDALSKKLIVCDNNSKCSLLDDSSNKFYLDYSTKSTSTDKSCGTGKVSFCSTNIISCDSSSQCISKAIVNESYFIDGETAVSSLYTSY